MKHNDKVDLGHQFCLCCGLCKKNSLKMISLREKSEFESSRRTLYKGVNIIDKKCRFNKDKLQGRINCTHHHFQVFITIYFTSLIVIFNLPLHCDSVGANETTSSNFIPLYYTNKSGAIKLEESDFNYYEILLKSYNIRTKKGTSVDNNYKVSFATRNFTSKMERDEFYNGVFPSNFKWGVATSSYQIEGGWNADGKGENIWDRFCHSDPSRILDKSNGDIACDSYSKYKEDVQLVKNMGAKVYRLSISWARVLPKGTTEKVNQAGIDYYNKIIDALIAEGIEPMLTLFHWDLPQNLQEMGGWENEQLISLFGEYARICYQNFGDRVKSWITFNEPILGYDIGIFAPGIKQPATSPYQCVHSCIKAHAIAYHIYKEEFAIKQKGKIGIAVDCWWYEPADPKNSDDVAAAERALQFRIGWILAPIIKGDYPTVMREFIGRHSKLENRSESRLPLFSPEWMSKIKGSIDFLGLNHYTTELVKTKIPSVTDKPSWSTDTETERFHDKNWPGTGSPWLKIVPWGLRKLLNWIKNEYGSNLEMMITENGCSDKGGLNDSLRIQYFNLYINEVLKAVNIDKCNVTGYLAWSLMDVFEWNVGYTEKFGINQVDFNDPNRTRTPKDSAKFLRKIFSDNGFPHSSKNKLLQSKESSESSALSAGDST